nr:MAG TPA_asm: hypothetical protein [Caudoviricetes sp.]
MVILIHCKFISAFSDFNSLNFSDMQSAYPIFFIFR